MTVKNKVKNKSKKQNILDKIYRRVQYRSLDLILDAERNRFSALEAHLREIEWLAGRRFCDPMFPKGNSQQREIDVACLDELIGRKN